MAVTEQPGGNNEEVVSSETLDMGALISKAFEIYYQRNGVYSVVAITRSLQRKAGVPDDQLMTEEEFNRNRKRWHRAWRDTIETNEEADNGDSTDELSSSFARRASSAVEECYE